MHFTAAALCSLITLASLFQLSEVQANPPIPQPEAELLNANRQHSDTQNLSNLLAQRASRREPPVFSPIQRASGRLINLETANQLLEGELSLRVGFQQTPPADRPAAGTGDEVYYGEVQWGLNNRLQLGLSTQTFEDPVNRPINGTLPRYTVISLAPSFKYQLRQVKLYSIAVHGSVEWLRLSTSPGLFNSTTRDQTDSLVVGTLQAPFSYNLSPEAQWHITPGIAIFPESLNGADFYGTFFNLGTGFSWQLGSRLNLQVDLNFPLGPGGNTLDSSDGHISRQLLWAVGASYAVSPRVQVEIYGTNGFGATPATRLLGFIPDSEQALIGANLTYTPDVGRGYGTSFRKGEPIPLSERDWQLVQDGITLNSANTLPPGAIEISGGATAGGEFHGGIAYSPDQDFQVELLFDEFEGEDNVSSADSAGRNLKHEVGVKLRFLDQQQGDPFSLSARLSGGRDSGESQQIGFLLPELPITYSPTPDLAIFVNPKAAFYSDESRVGVGLGANYALPGAQLIGEVTPIASETTVWSLGTRFSIPKTNVGLDLYATNAIGRHGLGTMVAESGVNVGFNVNVILGK